MSTNLGIDYGSFSITKYKNCDEEESEDEYDYQTKRHTRRFRKAHDHNKQTGSNWHAGVGLFPKPAPALEEGKKFTDVAIPTRNDHHVGIRFANRDVTPRHESSDDFQEEEGKICEVDPANPNVLYRRTRHLKRTTKIGDHVHQTQAGFGFQW